MPARSASFAQRSIPSSTTFRRANSAKAKLALAALAVGAPTLQAASQTWNSTGVSPNWSSPTNWGGNTAPGATGANNTDTATFNSSVGAVGTSTNPILIDNSPYRNLKFITFDTSNVGPFVIGTIGGNSISLSTTGAITVNPTVIAAQTINAPIFVSGTTGTGSFINNSTSLSAALTFGGSISAVASGGNTTFTFGGSNTGANTVNGIIGPSAATPTLFITKSGTGSWTFTRANTYTGTTRLAGGTLNLDFFASGAPTSNIVSGSSALGFGTLGSAIASSYSLNIIGKSATANLQSFNGVSVTGGTANLVLQPGTSGGTIALNLGALPTTRTNGAALDMTTNGQNISATGTIATSGLLANAITLNKTDFATISSGNLIAATANYVTNGATDLTGNRIINMTTSSSVTVNRTVAALRFNQSAATTLTIDPTRTLVLAENNGGAVLVTPNVGANNTIITGGTITGISSRDLALLQHNTQGNLVINSVIANNINPVAVTKSGLGAAITTGANTYTGRTYINEGRLQFAKQTALYNNTVTSWTSANINVAYGASLGLNVGGAGEFTSSDISTLTALGSAIDGFLDGSSVALDTTNAAGGNFTHASAICNPNAGANSIGLAKIGTGKLTLTGANTYSGPTTVEKGTLVVGVAGVGSIASNTTVKSSATLGGSGTISGSVAVESGGHLAPGNSVGTLIAGALSLTSGSVMDYEFNGSVNDFTQASTVTLASGNGGGFNLFAENSTSPYFTNGIYNLIGHTGTLTGFTPGVQTANGSSSSSFNVLNGQAGKKYTFSDTGSVIQLTIASLGPSIALSATIPTGFGNQLLDNSVAGGPADQGDFNPNSPANTLSVTGGSGSYSPGYVTSINSGNGDAANYVDIAGFNPSTDRELFALNLLNNGVALVPGVSADDVKIAQIIQDINEANSGVIASAISPTGFGGQFAGYDILLSFANPGANANGYFAFNFSGYTATNISNVTVSDLAMVPEPAGVTLLAIGAMTLASRRRRHH